MSETKFNFEGLKLRIPINATRSELHYSFFSFLDETKDAVVLHNDTTSTRIKSVALLVALIKPNGYIRFKENDAPYRGGEETWIYRILLETGEVKNDNTISKEDII